MKPRKLTKSQRAKIEAGADERKWSGLSPLCPECGDALIRTSERWQACPNGHGKLVQVSALVSMSNIEREHREFEKRLRAVEAALGRRKRAGEVT